MVPLSLERFTATAFNGATHRVPGCPKPIAGTSPLPTHPWIRAVMTEGKLSLLHVADWEFAAVPNRNSVVFRLHLVQGAAADQPRQDRKYVLTAAQAEGLRDALDSVLRELDTVQE